VLLRAESARVTKATIFNVSLDGVLLGSNLMSALIRQTRGAGLENKEELIHQFAFTVLMVGRSSRRVLDWFQPDTVFMSHGVYADWGPALKNSIKSGIPVVSYVTSYLQNHFYFGKMNAELSTFQDMSAEAWKAHSSRELTRQQEDRLLRFIRHRYVKHESHDMKGLLKAYSGNTSEIRRKLGIVEGVPVWGIITHVTWDSVVDYYPMVFDSLEQWLSVTLETAARITDVQWVIKIHPSEKNDNPLTGAQALVQRKFADLPPHMKLIGMDDDISPLDFFDAVDGGVTVFGTAGLELSLSGKPVILAGTPPYAQKGFTHDARDRHHYVRLLEDASKLARLGKNSVSLALRYAYCYFMLKQIPLPFIRNQFDLYVEKMHTLIPAQSPVVDFLCERILNGSDFILDEPEAVGEP
jgi:hypothetical protein